MIAFAAERLMELEASARTGAAHGERSPDRLVQRNGYVLCKFGSDFCCVGGRVLRRIEAFAVLVPVGKVAAHQVKKVAAHSHPQKRRLD